MRKLYSSKSVDSNKSKSSFAAEDNAFAAAMDEALHDDESRAVSLDDDIFLSIQNHDVAIDGDYDVSSFPASSSQSGSAVSSAVSGVGGYPISRPVVEELYDDKSKNQKKKSAFKKMASLPINIGRRKDSDKNEKIGALRSAKSDYTIGRRTSLESSGSVGSTNVNNSGSSIPLVKRVSRTPLPPLGLEPRRSPTREEMLQSQRSSKSNRSGRMKRRNSDDENASFLSRASSIPLSLLSKNKRLGGDQEDLERSRSLGFGLQQSSMSSSSFLKSNSNLNTVPSTASPSSASPQVPYGPGSYTSRTSSNRPTLPPRMGSHRSTSSYEIPMPTMPFETREAHLVRVAMAILFFGASLAFTILLGRGEIGMAVTTWLYNTLIVDGDGGSGATVSSESLPLNGAHLFPIIEGLERSHKPNTEGNPDFHLPRVTLEGNELEIEIGLKPHSMTEEHFIQYIWLRDLEAESIVLAKEFWPTDESPPVLRAKVPHGVTLQPMVFCNLHYLWQGTSFKVPDLN